jgi:heme-degrading monooxygenase HmoA
MFLVVFRNRKRADIDSAAYSADAERMEELARAQPGFLSFKSYTSDDGEVVALSEWADAASARAWGAQPDHSVIQAKGRAEYYQDYTLYTAENPRTHRFERPR